VRGFPSKVKLEDVKTKQSCEASLKNRKSMTSIAMTWIAVTFVAVTPIAGTFLAVTAVTLTAVISKDP
jgi:hypothetical protein